MKHFTSRRTAGSRAFLCLLLSLFICLGVDAQEICPAYPRAMDQVYACYEPSKIKLEQSATLHNPVRFTFPALPPDISVTFDAGDGNGPINVSSNGDILAVSYASPGQYPLTWTMSTAWGNFSGTITFQTNFNPDFPYADNPDHFTIPSTAFNVNTYTPSPGGAYPPGSPNTAPVTAGGIVHILYANPDHQLRKPFILVEGFDPILGPSNEYVVNDLEGNPLGYGDVRWDVVTTGRSEAFDPDPNEQGVPHNSRFDLFPTLLAELRNRGYDIVYVDFADGAAYLQANAEFLTGVLEWVNSTKITDEENVLIGASMGGIIGRYVLAKLESEGKSHCTGLFFTLDSPHNGANVPLSFQALGWYFHASGNTDEVWNVMETPAARQMLLKHLGTAVQDGDVTPENDPLIYTTPLDFSEFYNADYSFLRNQINGELDGFGWPKFPRKVALSNGMKNGTLPNGQGFGPGEKFYECRAYATDFDLGTVFRLFLRSNNGGGPDFYSINGLYQCSNYQDNGFSDDHLFTIAAPHDFNPCYVGPWGSDKVPYLYHVMRLRATGDLPFLDNAPGGYSMELRALHSKLKSEIGSSADYQNPVNFPKVTFVPTWSALAMGTSLTNPNLFVDLNAPEFDEDNLPNNKIPNFDNFYAPSASLRHVELDGGMIDLILNEIDALGAAPQPGILTEVYNYGDKYKQIPNTIVASTGVLNINNPGPTGYVQSSPQGNAVKPTFTTYLNSCGQVITVESGGHYNIGALDKSQHGITEVWEGATVHIKSGGILHITSNSSKLIIKHGATLILDAGAIVRLESPNSSIQINGDLVVNGDINFGGPGYFNFGEGNRLVFGPGYNTFNLTGMGKDIRFVQLNAPVEIDNAHRLNWRNGLMESGAGFLHLTEGAGLDFTNITLNGGGDFAIDAYGSGAITLQGCKVENLFQPVVGVGGSGCSIIECEFSDIGFLGVSWTTAFMVRVKDSNFTSSNTFSMALYMTDVAFLVLDGSQFTGYGGQLQGIITDSGLEQALPAVNLENMVGCFVKGSSFTDNAIGIKAADLVNPGATANVFAFGASSFIQNSAGIFVNGTATQGTVLADCVTFDRNSNGIRGRDIALMIDSRNTKIFQFDTDSPNMFIRDNAPSTAESHVQICYELKAPGGSSLMRNNAWRINQGGVLTQDFQPENEVFLRRNICSINVPPTFVPSSSKDPLCILDEQPASFAEPFPGSECMLVVGSGGTTSNPILVHEQFHLGTFLMKSDSVEAGIEAMRPVAALWQPDMSNYTANCQQYIQVAKAFVDASDNMLPDLQRPSVERTKVSTLGSLVISPNPANGSAMVHLSPAMHQLRVWDAQGNLCQQATASDTYRIDTVTWQPGLYVIETVAADGSRRSGKLVIQR